MRVATVAFVVVGVLLLHPAISAAQDLPAPASGSAPAPGSVPAPPSGSVPAPASGSAPAPASGSAPAPAASSTGGESSPLPPPVAGTAVDTNGANLTGVPNPTAAPASGDDWHFFTHGYFRAPLRVGVGKRPACGAGQNPGTVINGVPCAGPGQSTTNLHSPFLPDDQYLDWRYTRQWEQDWTEVFLNYGNSRVVGTVGFQAYNLTDAGFNDTGAQLGIAQGYVTVTPDVGLAGVRLKWKVGSFWEKYGQAGQYDAGAYDTYMFGRTHQIGESLAAEMDAGDFTFKLTHGIGAKLEQVAAGQAPTAGAPGFTLLDHLHAGVAYKKIVDANLHYLVSWAQDARATPTTPDGKIAVVGGEVRLTGGVAGQVYAAYSRVTAENAGAVGPAIEVIHSLGGGGHQTGNGLIDNYLGACTTCTAADVGTGSIDTVEIAYNYRFGLLYRKLKDPRTTFWGDGMDLTLGVFGMYTAVTSKDTMADGVKKLKYGGDLVFRALSWLGIGARADVVQPSSKDASESFWVISPKIMFHTAFITHEEITAQYSHYSYNSGVTPQPPNNAFPPDENVFGVKATMWW
jgi:hypothetical protein